MDVGNDCFINAVFCCCFLSCGQDSVNQWTGTKLRDLGWQKVLVFYSVDTCLTMHSVKVPPRETTVLLQFYEGLLRITRETTESTENGGVMTCFFKPSILQWSSTLRPLLGVTRIRMANAPYRHTGPVRSGSGFYFCRSGFSPPGWFSFFFSGPVGVSFSIIVFGLFNNIVRL